MADSQGAKKRSLFQLFADVPTLVRELVAGEIELLKQEMIAKLKALGIGAGLLLGAAIVLLFMIGVLLTAAVLALALVLPGWASALIIAGVLLVIAVIVGLAGYSKLKKGIPPIPSETISGLKKDLNVIKGVGKKPAGSERAEAARAAAKANPTNANPTNANHNEGGNR